MKSVGIITIHHSINYGASLQSFALFQFLKDSGFDVKVIDLYRPIYKGYVTSKRFLPYYPKKKSVVLELKNLYRQFLAKKRADNAKYEKAMERFAEFNSQVNLTKPYRSIDSLYDTPPLFDTYISGSDQIWNPDQPYCLEPYFLTFAPKGTRRISYASSIGLKTLPEKVKTDFAQWLSQYDAISIREMQGKAILEEFVDKDIAQVPDPSFLLSREQWMQQAVLPESDNYICMFTLRHPEKLYRLADTMARTMQVKLVIVGHSRRTPNKDFSCEYVRDAGPKEFLGYLAKASCVLTDSFHGTVFSILMGARNIYSYRQEDSIDASTRFGRIEDLLATFDLSDHIVSSSENPDVTELYNNNIDYSKIDSIISRESLRGQEFLLKNI